MPLQRPTGWIGMWESSYSVPKRMNDGHPCKFLSTEKHRIFWARSGERAIGLIRICRYAIVPLGWWFLLSAEPDIHLLSKTPKSPHRRLSLCSLPVPKQFRESFRSLISFAQSANGGTWQPAHRNNPDVFPFLGRVFHAAAVDLNCSVGTKSCFLRSTARRYATSFLATASVARFVFPRSRSFS